MGPERRGSADINATDHNWSDATDLGRITLPAGRYVMKLTIVAHGLNLDTLTFTKD